MSDNKKKPWLKATTKEISNLTKNWTFIVEDPEKDETVTTCMYVYKAKIKSDGSLDKLKLRIVVRGDLQNKELVGDTWSPTSSIRTLKYFLQGLYSIRPEAYDPNITGIMGDVSRCRAMNLEVLMTAEAKPNLCPSGNALCVVFAVAYSAAISIRVAFTLFMEGCPQFRVSRMSVKDFMSKTAVIFCCLKFRLRLLET